MLNASIQSVYELWLAKLPAGDPLREELKAVRGDEKELTDRFYQEIVFGTAGLRGICGAGTNRMNRLTVGRATQGIANYINQPGHRHNNTSYAVPGSDAWINPAETEVAWDTACAAPPDTDLLRAKGVNTAAPLKEPAPDVKEQMSAPTPAQRGVVIAYDCRYHSKEFSELSAEILAGNGIHCFLFPSLRPTPELSYAIRRLHAVSGINMTASHNPKDYNGYKVYWEDGAQISGAVSDGMLREIQTLDFFQDSPKRMPLSEAVDKGLVTMLGEEMDRSYLDYVLSMAQRPDEELDKSVPIIYTPLNGAGSIPLAQIMKERGFSNFRIVPEQKDPDPEFTTVGYPNPEDAKAFALSEQLGRETGAEVLIATDPDSDRMAIEIPDGKGGYRALNGNQTGALLIAYMAQSRIESGTLPEKAAMIQSIVTGDFGRCICESYGIEVFDALTGFKNICGRIPELEAKGYEYFFGYEESIGCAPGAAVRDKDGICAGMLIGEMAAYYRKNGQTIADALEELYQKYGYYAEAQVSVVLKGQEGAARIGRIMDAFRMEYVITSGPKGRGQNAAAAQPAAKGSVQTTETVLSDADAAASIRADSGSGYIGAFAVREVIDYIDGYQDVPAGNVLRFTMENGSWFAMRPSGTEPKIKFYYYAVADNPAVSQNLVSRLTEAVNEKISGIE